MPVRHSVVKFRKCCLRSKGLCIEITLEVPETVAKALGQARETLPWRALEALLVDECALGRLSRGKVAELLDLSFHETEDLFRAHRVPYPIKSSADDSFDNASLPSRRGCALAPGYQPH